MGKTEMHEDSSKTPAALAGHTGAVFGNLDFDFLRKTERWLIYIVYGFPKKVNTTVPLATDLISFKVCSATRV
jgi:hypothetical protein